ncbi:MAG: DNA polymerase I [Phycisphaeraceae bacterium]
MPPPNNTLYIIDGHAQIFRAYFAIRGGMTSPITGEPTHAVFGFAGMLLKLFNQFKPQYVVMAIDSPGKTFRDELYDQYKAHRPPAPADLASQEQRIFELTRMFGVPILAHSGAEADDIIATVVRRVLADPAQPDLHLRMVSKDKDLEQLLGPRVTMFDIHTDTTIDTAWLKENKGVTPEQVVDMLAMIGDKVDNVPGVEGIGPKTAAALISEFGSIDHLLANLDKIKGKRRENLEKGKATLPLSRKLVQLKDDLALDFTLADAAIRPVDASGVRHMFEELGFRRHQTDLDKLLGQRAAMETTEAKPQAAEKSEIRNPTASTAQAKSEIPRAAPFATSLFEDDQPTATATTTATQTSATAPDAADYRAITTRAQLDDLCTTLARQTLIAFDTETIGLGSRVRLCGLSLAWQPGSAVYLPICSPQQASHLDEAAVLNTLRSILENPAIGKCGHNLKYDLRVVRHAGVAMRGVVFDSMIASHLLNEPGHGLDHLALSHLHHHMMQISELIGIDHGAGPLLGSQRTMDQVPLERITTYAADDAEVSLRLHDVLEPRLKLLGMEELSQRVEMPLVEVLAEMEHHGIRVDGAVLQEQKRVLAGRIEQLQAEIHQHAGSIFNIDSTRQLGDVLFKQLALPIVKRTKTGASTDVEVLEKLADRDDLSPQQTAVLGRIVEYRQLTKLVNTYLDNLRQSIRPDSGRVHAQFQQTGAATGRLSSNSPNLQNIPIRTEIGRNIRKAFIAEPGHRLISADYSQIELRVLAHLSHDKALIEAFEQDLDIHAAVAAQVFGVPLEQVTREQRASAKVINFGIVYGVTPYGLARRIEGLDLERARTLISDYKRRFAGIGEFLDKCIAQAEQLGYVTTIMGRRRQIREIASRNPNVRSLGERLAINSVVQGSAADLIKLAMVNLYQRIHRDGLPLKLLLQIHDELVLEAPESAADDMARIVEHEMQHAMDLRVPLKVQAGVGADWFSVK